MYTYLCTGAKSRLSLFCWYFVWRQGNNFHNDMKPLLSFSHRSDKGAKPIDPKGFPWVDLKRCRHCHFAYNHHHQLFDNGTLGNQGAQNIIYKNKIDFYPDWFCQSFGFCSDGTMYDFHEFLTCMWYHGETFMLFNRKHSFLRWQQHDSNFMLFNPLMVVAIMFLCKNAVEAI